DCEYDQRKRVREYGCADRDDDRLEPKYTQPLDDWNAQQRMGCEERSDDDRQNEGIAKTEAEQGSEEQRHDGGKKAEDDRSRLRPAEQGYIDLEPGREHQQQFAQLGEEIRNRPVLAEETEHVRSQRNPEKEQA